MFAAIICTLFIVSATSKSVVEKTNGLIVARNDQVEFQFLDENGGFGISQIISFLDPQNYSYILPDDNSSDYPTIWYAEFRGEDGRGYYIDSTVSSQKSYFVNSTSEGIQITFIWENINLGFIYTNTSIKITSTFSLETDSSLATFGLTIENPRIPYNIPCLWTVSYPTINNVGTTRGNQSNATIVYQQGLGTLGAAGSSNFYSAYPAGDWTLQFMSYCQTDELDCLYLASHDPSANYKFFEFYGDNYDGVNSTHLTLSSMTIVNVPPDSCSALNDQLQSVYTIPYPLVFGPFRGDYWDATQIYRNFALQQAPWAQTPLQERKDTPKWFLELPMWFNTGWEGGVLNWTEGDPKIVIPRSAAIMDLFNVTDAGMHWYCWHQIPFDTDYPEYFPPRQGFGSAVPILQAMGIRIFPYINARIFDYNAELWETDNAELFASKQSAPRLRPKTIQTYVENYGSRQNFATMCPATDYWQDKISSIVDELVNAYMVDGVYVDQIGAASAVACFDPSHGHTLGGGNYWYEGYNTLLQDCSTAAHKKKQGALVTESNAEFTIGKINGNLIINGFEQCPALNTFSAVYGGYYVPFGRIFQVQDFEGQDFFTIKMSQSFTLGTQLGWFSLGGQIGIYDQLVDPANLPQIHFVKNLIQYRQFTLQYLLYGRLMRNLPISTNASAVPIEGCPLMPINANVWMAQDGTLGIPIANGASTQYFDFAFTLSADLYNLNPTVNYKVNSISPTGTAELGSFTGSFLFNMTISPYNIMFLQIEPF